MRDTDTTNPGGDDTVAAGGQRLPKGHGSLALGVPSSSEPGKLYALSLAGGIAIGPKEGRTILFGRNRPDVHVCVGEDDRKVSRQQGTITYDDGVWWLANTGKLPLRLPGSRLLFRDEEPVPLTDGYTPMFLRGTGRREHLLELYVTGAEGRRPTSRHGDATELPRIWRLSDDERLALVVLGQRYLLHA